MDDQALIRTYGNTNLPEGTEDRPLVTFALFAYNQEKYIREAVEGAFSQTYSPLEIILSDDCSCDRTFEIIEEMAASYEGPHQVVVRRNSENMNVAPHVVKVMRAAKGDYFVLAAGDDISHPLRTEKIINCFHETGAAGVHSRCRLIDEFGNIVETNYVSQGDLYVRSWFKVDQRSFVHGATSAYSKAVLEYVPEEPHGIHAEDGLLTIAILANGLSVHFLESHFVDYRTHESSLSNDTATKRNFRDIIEHERKLSRSVGSYLNLCSFALDIVKRSTSKCINKTEVSLRIEETIAIFSLRQRAYSHSFRQRLKALGACKSVNEIRFSLSRLFGLKLFSFIKVISSIGA